MHQRTYYTNLPKYSKEALEYNFVILLEFAKQLQSKLHVLQNTTFRDAVDRDARFSQLALYCVIIGCVNGYVTHWFTVRAIEYFVLISIQGSILLSR